MAVIRKTGRWTMCKGRFRHESKFRYEVIVVIHPLRTKIFHHGGKMIVDSRLKLYEGRPVKFYLDGSFPSFLIFLYYEVF